jgi:hypothetical protein
MRAQVLLGFTTKDLTRVFHDLSYGTVYAYVFVLTLENRIVVLTPLHRLS